MSEKNVPVPPVPPSGPPIPPSAPEVAPAAPPPPPAADPNANAKGPDPAEIPSATPEAITGDIPETKVPVEEVVVEKTPAKKKRASKKTKETPAELPVLEPKAPAPPGDQYGLETPEQAEASVQESMKDLIELMWEKHKEFEEKFNVLMEAKDKTKRADAIDSGKVFLVLAQYPSIGSWYLTESRLAHTTEARLKEKYDQWYSVRSPEAERQMKGAGEHITQATIRTKVNMLYRAEAEAWNNLLLKAKENKELLTGRLKIIGDSKYSLNSLSMLRPIWDSQANTKAPSALAIDAADESMSNINKS